MSSQKESYHFWLYITAGIKVDIVYICGAGRFLWRCLSLSCSTRPAGFPTTRKTQQVRRLGQVRQVIYINGPFISSYPYIDIPIDLYVHYPYISIRLYINTYTYISLHIFRPMKLCRYIPTRVCLCLCPCLSLSYRSLYLYTYKSMYKSICLCTDDFFMCANITGIALSTNLCNETVYRTMSRV